MIYIDKVVKAIAKYCVPEKSFVTKISNVFFNEWVIRWTDSFIAVQYNCKQNKWTGLINWKQIKNLEIKKPVVWLYLENKNWKAHLKNKDIEMILNIEQEEKGKELDWDKIKKWEFVYQYNLNIFSLEDICKIFKSNWDKEIKVYSNRENTMLKLNSSDDKLEIILRAFTN